MYVIDFYDLPLHRSTTPYASVVGRKLDVTIAQSGKFVCKFSISIY